MDQSITVQSLSEIAMQLTDAQDLECYSALFGQPLVLFEAKPDSLTLDATARATLHARLGELPCPVIALQAPDQHPPAAGLTDFTDLADVVVSSLREAQSLVRNIRANPLAAMVLVQLLRHNARVGMSDGLFAESLAFATLQGGA